MEQLQTCNKKCIPFFPPLTQNKQTSLTLSYQKAEGQTEENEKIKITEDVWEKNIKSNANNAEKGGKNMNKK